MTPNISKPSYGNSAHNSARLHPYLDSASTKLSPILDSGYSLKTKVEDRLPEGVYNKISYVKNQVGYLVTLVLAINLSNPRSVA